MIQARLKSAVSQALRELEKGELEKGELKILLNDGEGADFDYSLERPAHLEHGDWSSNVALILGNKAGIPPMELAESLAEIINRGVDKKKGKLGSACQEAHIERAEAKKPGFLNLFLSNGWLYETIRETLEAGVKNFARPLIDTGKEGAEKKGNKKKILVEFVSANPTGPLHAGHAKGAVLGDTLARVYERCGYEVVREYYVNDLGNQVDLYAASLAAALKGSQPPEDGYQGRYIKKWAKEWQSEKELQNEKSLKELGIEKAIADQREVLKKLGIEFDSWFPESSLQSGSAEALEELKNQKAVYEKDGALWFRASDYGDDKDRVLVKSDGSFTYLLPDIAYHLDKLKRAEKVINIWGADHHGYTGRLRAALKALGGSEEHLQIIICQLVRLESGGEEVKISKRTGEIILLRDLVDELGASAVRFAFLLQSADSAQTVDLEKAAAQSMDNPVYYVQYAHARIFSIFNKLEEQAGSKNPPDISTDLNLLAHPAELELMRTLSDMPHLVKEVCEESAPHKLTSYLRSLAGAFHSFYHECSVISSDTPKELTAARTDLINAVAIALKVGLDLCGVEAPQKMEKINEENK